MLCKVREESETQEHGSPTQEARALLSQAAELCAWPPAPATQQLPPKAATSQVGPAAEWPSPQFLYSTPQTQGPLRLL